MLIDLFEGMLKMMHDKVQYMAEVFKALGDPTRLRIIRMLASNMENNLCVADLAKKIGVSQPAASQHIKILKNIGILEANREGYRVFYNINVDTLTTHKSNIDEMFNLAMRKCENYGSCKGHR